MVFSLSLGVPAVALLMSLCRLCDGVIALACGGHDWPARGGGAACGFKPDPFSMSSFQLFSSMSRRRPTGGLSPISRTLALLACSFASIRLNSLESIFLSYHAIVQVMYS